jgi:hypothetical protein
VIIDSSLQAYWNADNGAADAIGNGHDGTFHGNAVAVSGSPFGNAFVLDGNGDYLDIGDELDMGASDFTLSACVSSNPLPNDGGLGTPITTAHYDLWRAHFGQAVGSNAATIDTHYTSVPEPSTFALWLLTAVGLSMRPRRPK